MNFNCREANISDMKAVHDLIVELAIYEQEPNEVETTPEELVKLGFELDPPFFKCFVAELNNKIIGTAIVYNAFSTWKGKTVHLEDFIVNKNIRNKVVGGKLFDLVLRYSKNIGAKRLSLNAISVIEKESIGDLSFLEASSMVNTSSSSFESASSEPFISGFLGS